MPLDTLAYIKTRSPLKVSIVFALGILLPSLILSYIGLRSYRNEERLMQKEAEERYAVVADLVQKKVSKRFSDLILSLREVAAKPGFQRLETAQILPVLLSPPPLSGLSGYDLFVFDESDRMIAPWQEAPQSGGTPDRQDLDWGSLTKEIERLEQIEFVDKDYARAIQGYSTLQSKTSSPSLQAALLKNIAGDYRKLHQNRAAAATYLKLARSYEQVLDLTGVPMGILGRQAAIKLYEEEKDRESAFEMRLDLLEGLIFRRWRLSAQQFSSLWKEDYSALEKSSNDPGRVSSVQRQRWDHLRSVQGQLQRLEQEGKRFAEKDRAELLRRVHSQGRFSSGLLLQIPSQSAQKLAVVVPILAASSDRRLGYLVGSFPADTVWSALNETMIESTQASGLQVEWDRPGLKGNLTRHLGTPSIQREIEGINPPVHFKLVDSGASLHNQLAKRRQWVFVGIVGLSFVVILVGIAIMAQALKREIEVANLKADFVANVSHELRTPLTVISQIEEKLSAGRYGSEDEKKQIYSLLSQQTGRLRGLVEEFLDFSKILAGKKTYRSEPVDLLALVQESVDLFDPKAEGSGFQILTHYPLEPVPILGDSRAILQAVLNLLDNAMKYSGDARELEVWVRKTATQGIVAVKDRGIGISKLNQDKIFDKFYRVEEKHAAHLASGVGLGLAMIKHVVEGHRGEIGVESEVGKGSTFSLIFPLAAGGH